MEEGHQSCLDRTIMNVVFIQTNDGLQSGVEFGLFITIWLIGYIALIPLTGWLTRRNNLPEFTAWRTEHQP